MVVDPKLRARPSRTRLAQLAAALAPGARIAGVRMLGGGIDAGTHAFDLHLPEGGRRKFVLRRFDPRWLVDDAERPGRLWTILQELARLGVTAPRPVWFDREGALFGVPTLVMTREPGRPQLCPRNPERWGEQLGTALARLHTTPLDAAAGRTMRPARFSFDDPDEWLVRRAKTHKVYNGERIIAAIEHGRASLPRGEGRLLHFDYWPGNTLWSRGRLLSIIDWDGAVIGDPDSDVAYARLDPFILSGWVAADALLRAYEHTAGRRVRRLGFWELVAAVRFLPDPAQVISGYHDLGRIDITPALMRDRFRTFIDAALQRLP